MFFYVGGSQTHRLISTSLVLIHTEGRADRERDVPARRGNFRAAT
jgi:hypothetical protein